MSPSQIISLLNSLGVGEIDKISAKLREAEQACRDLSQDELAARLIHARESLATLDVKAYRKDVEAVVSKLGHLR